MTTKPLQNKANCAKNEAGPKALPTPTTPDRNPSYYPRITTLNQHNDRAESAQREQPENWQSLGDLARKLAENAGGVA
ncbi:hypothetical protein [Oceaniglobus trochenteri]|uniref:hypothetical protein n=1 Tax=Oceaniglobus trochenteri TaxID=2763260 RepID=UPI001CFF63B5|nr:hypothetical protein [Oceaniglobus trochenteri]